MTTLAPELISARATVSDELFGRLTARLVKDHGIDPGLAGRTIEQTLVFLHACFADPDESLTPSRLVDLGWHTFVLHTREYAAFCRSVAGQFIHHVPDSEPPARLADRINVRLRTLDAVARTGFAVDRDLWSDHTDVSCHDDEGCSGTGKDGNENRDSQIPR